MQIRSESIIRYPRNIVYEAYRDRLPEIVEYIHDIREIKVLSRKDVDGGVTLHNEWRSDREIPRVAASILTPEHLCWDDFAHWSDEEHHVDWVIKTRAFTDSVQCSGRNTFVDEGGQTRIRLTGELQINLRNIPGVPNFLSKRIAPQIEKFIVSLITPNLEQVNRSLQTFLDNT